MSDCHLFAIYERYEVNILLWGIIWVCGGDMRVCEVNMRVCEVIMRVYEVTLGNTVVVCYHPGAEIIT